jgi:excisionase family DNA binding protein
MSAKPSDIPPNDLHTAEEVAAFLKVDPKTVFNWAKSGVIPEAFRVGKTVRFSLEAVKASLEIKCPDMGKSKRSTEDILRLAFSMIDPMVFPAPAWMLVEDDLDPRDADHARLVADRHRESIGRLTSIEEKIGYAGGVLDAQLMMDAEMRSGTGNGGA